jgi:murein DD-endopeptidase MepM/ murein hydrolase activator NlpD
MYWIEEDAGASRHFSFGREPRRALLVLLLSALAVVGCTTWIDRRVRPAGEESVSIPLPARPPPRVEPAPQAALRMPVAGVAPAALRDSFRDDRGGRRHQAIDIMAPRGTPVVAAVAGEVAKVYRHPLGGLSVYQYDSRRHFAYYYAHLDAFAQGLKAGVVLAAGDPVGVVGTTGNATPGSPHLHFAIYRLGAERQWWRGTPVDPYPLLTRPPSASP